jgi:hypothetical protein
MSFLGNLLNGAQGAGFQAVTPSQDQLASANNNVNNAIGTQQAFVNAVNPSLNAGLASQQALTGQLQNEAAGQGPNPALAQLNQTTGANVANQAALMAGQRGSSSNAGLIARQAAQQGAATQQQAVGQGATLVAQQQLAAQSNLTNLANSEVGQVQGANSALQNATASNQGNLYGAQSNANSTNASIAAGNAKTQANIASMVPGVGAGIASSFLADGGKVPQQPILQSAPLSAPQPPPQSSPTQGPQSKIGQYLAGMSQSANDSDNPVQQGFKSGQDFGKQIGNLIHGAAAPEAAEALGTDAAASVGTGAAAGAEAGGGLGLLALLAKGGKVPAMVSPGEVYLSPNKAKKVAEGKASPKSGEKIPGKAKVRGDSLKNDTVPRNLEPGGVVIPRSKTEGETPEVHMQRFVESVMARQGMKRGKR